MKAWAIVKSGAPLEQIERPARVPQGAEVVLKVEYAGVCHSDIHLWKGYYDMGGGKKMLLADRGVTLPRAPGHEIVARVTKLGPQATGVQVGDLRVVYPWLGCGHCERCLHDEGNLCSQTHIIGVMEDGGFGDEVVVPDAKYLVDPGDVDPAYAATLACSGVTVYSAIKKLMPLGPDQPVVLIGAGGLGLAAVSMLRALDHRNIVSVDVSAEKRAAALEMGATQFVDASLPDLPGRLLSATGGPVLGVIDFVNSSSTSATGLECLAKGGKLVLVGVAGGEIVVSLASMIFKPRTIHGTVTGNLRELREVVELARSGKLKPIPVTRMPKDKANEAFSSLSKGEVKGRIVLTAQGASRPVATAG